MGNIHLASLFWIALFGQGDDAAWQVSVELVDTTGMPSSAMEALQSEVEEIYASASVRIQWLQEGVHIHLPEHAARVYILDRLPAMLGTRLRTFRGKTPMAVTLGGSGSESGHAIYVSRSEVSGKASSGMTLLSASLGRAMGRVVAHELAHRFVSRDHSRSGILREGLLPSDLTGPVTELLFTKEQVSLLRRVAQPVAEHVSAQK
jgi:hypothetical protein